MTTLVEKVARTLCKHACLGWSDEPDGNGDYFCDAARAALAVFIAHYSNPGNVSDEMIAKFLDAFFEEGSGVKLEDFPRAAFALAAAMKAAI
jgi:hypothetical protein